MLKADKNIVSVDVGGTFCDGYCEIGEKAYTIKILSTGRLRATILKKITSNKWIIHHQWSLSYPHLLDGCKCFFNKKTFEVKAFDHSYSVVEFESKQSLKIGSTVEFGIDAEAPILAAHLLTGIPISRSLNNVELRVGTTKGTNAMLEQKGVPCIWITNRGLKDLLYIKTQQRPHLFQLDIPEPICYHHKVIECNARMDAFGNEQVPLKINDLEKIKRVLKQYPNSPIAIAFIHSYKNPKHEIELKKYLEKNDFKDISCSSLLHPSIHLLPRSETAVCNAYLNPVLRAFVESIESRLDDTALHLMTSAGHIMPSRKFNAKDSLLSGPAGGIKAAESIGKKYKIKKIITFDMGGTSTDTARIDTRAQIRFRSKIGNTEISSPSFNIETVAAGGGSIIDYKNGKFTVGPESAGAHPGPACYGYGGPFTNTDLQLLQGKLIDHAFNIPIHKNASKNKYEDLLKKAKIKNSPDESKKILAGIERIANEMMAEAIRKISLGQGYNPAEYTLVVFGGAGGLHACNIAEILKIKNILIPFHAGILSAYGINQTERESLKIKQVNELLKDCQVHISKWFDILFNAAAVELIGIPKAHLKIAEQKLYLRYAGQQQTIPIQWSKSKNILHAFSKAYRAIHNTVLDQPLELESLSLTLQSNPNKIRSTTLSTSQKAISKTKKNKVFWESLNAGDSLIGPLTIYSHQATLFLDREWKCDVQLNKDLYFTHLKKSKNKSTWTKSIELELFTNRFQAIAEQMGTQLQFSAFSVNVKERLDFSCAILDPDARLISNAPHIPVHLGSLGICARLILKEYKIKNGDVIICNHPIYGGSHLPDITLIKGVFLNRKLLGYVINRAHHAEIGGMTPGSMPPFANRLVQEGVVFSPMYLIKDGEEQWDIIQHQLKNAPYPSRNIKSNLLDIKAALLALKTGEEKLIQLSEQYGPDYVINQMREVLNYSDNLIKLFRKQHQGFKSKAIEKMDDSKEIHASIQVSLNQIVFDFTGTSGTHIGNLNANKAIVHSVILYILRLLVNEKIPLNEGLSQDVKVILPESFIHPRFYKDPYLCPAVVGGNTEVSQRLTDTLIKAFSLAACSQGTMNNFLFGNDTYSYYETIGGGVGAGVSFHGRSAIHQHMTNTKITDPEELELRYPVQLDRFEVRKNSGGKGKYTGGDGITRQITFLEPMTVTILAQHRKEKPFGASGGGEGKTGSQYHISNGKSKKIKANEVIEVTIGDSIRIDTPGGGGWGKSN